MEETLEDLCNSLRTELKVIEDKVRAMKRRSEFNHKPENYPGQHDEMINQSILSVRHIEDARMRLGKVLQYSRDGVSIFDTK